MVNHCIIDKIQIFGQFFRLGGVLLPALRGEPIFEKRTQNEHLTIVLLSYIRQPYVQFVEAGCCLSEQPCDYDLGRMAHVPAHTLTG